MSLEPLIVLLLILASIIFPAGNQKERRIEISYDGRTQDGFKLIEDGNNLEFSFDQGGTHKVIANIDRDKDHPLLFTYKDSDGDGQTIDFSSYAEDLQALQQAKKDTLKMENDELLLTRKDGSNSLQLKELGLKITIH